MLLKFDLVTVFPVLGIHLSICCFNKKSQQNYHGSEITVIMEFLTLNKVIVFYSCLINPYVAL